MEKNKTIVSKSETRGLKTTFATAEFFEVIEALNKANEVIVRLSCRYEKDDERRNILNGMSDTISLDFYSKLEKIIGSDFVECTLNIKK